MMKDYKTFTTFKRMALIALLTFCTYAFSQAQDHDLNYYISQAPFPMPKVVAPKFPNNIFNIKDYGAKGDGQTLNTQAFAAAISDCNKAGGGKVVVPPGLWLTGPIELKSNVNLHVERGALVQFTSDHTQFPIIKASAKSSNYQVASPIHGYALKNIAITGSGIIDGAGQTWRPVKKEKTTESQWKELIKSGGVVSKDGKVWWPTKEAYEGRAYLKKLKKEGKRPTPVDLLPARDFLRPKMVYLVGCQNVLIQDITLRNSPAFVLYPNHSEDVIIKNAKVYNDWWAQNGDGIDISACRNVVVYKCDVSVGDDGICMKSSGAGPESGIYELENILIAGCNVNHAHGGFVVGSNTNGNIRNVFVTDCNYVGTDIGIRMKSTAGKGGITKDIYIKNIYMTGIRNAAISFNTFYQNVSAGTKRNGKNPVLQHDVPVFRNIHISNVYCKGANQSIYMAALPASPIQDIFLDNVWISAKNGADINNVKGISLKNVKTDIQHGPVYKLTNAQDITIDNGFMPKSAKIFIEASGTKSKNISVVNTSFPGLKGSIIAIGGATPQAVKVK